MTGAGLTAVSMIVFQLQRPLAMLEMVAFGTLTIPCRLAMNTAMITLALCRNQVAIARGRRVVVNGATIPFRPHISAFLQRMQIARIKQEAKPIVSTTH